MRTSSRNCELAAEKRHLSLRTCDITMCLTAQNGSALQLFFWKEVTKAQQTCGDFQPADQPYRYDNASPVPRQTPHRLRPTGLPCTPQDSINLALILRTT